MHVYKYTPPTGGSGIDGGSWQRFFLAARSATPPRMTTPRSTRRSASGSSTQGDRPLLFARKHSSGFPHSAAGVLQLVDGARGTRWRSRTTSRATSSTSSIPTALQPSCYLSLQVSNLAPGGRGAYNAPGSAPDDTAELTGRTRLGARAVGLQRQWTMELLSTWTTTSASRRCRRSATRSDSPAIPIARSRRAARPGRAAPTASVAVPPTTRPFRPRTSTACSGDELLARASDGLRVRKWVPGTLPAGRLGLCCRR